MPAYAADPSQNRIRMVSSTKSEELFNDIAINLLNGRSRFVSLDHMVKILKDYEIVEICSDDIAPARDIILREVAFRMLKHHYLPRVGDKIKVYKQGQEFTEEATPKGYIGLETSIYLPVEVATIKDENQIKTIYWNNLVMQISSVIEKLWLKRVGYKTQEATGLKNEEAIIEAALLLRKRYISGEDISDYLDKQALSGKIVMAAEGRIDLWQKEGVVDRKGVPLLAEIIIQYVVLSNPNDAARLASEIKVLRGTRDLKDALRNRIVDSTETIKAYNPADYGAFAMLQSLFNDMSAYFSFLSGKRLEEADSKDVEMSRHSA